MNLTMIPIQPATPSLDDPSDIIIPPEMSAIFDEADIPNGPHSAVMGDNTVSLVVTATKEVVRTVPWADCNRFSRRLLEASLKLTLGDGK